jgi:L,D-transpeptidase catalytic domain
VIEPVRLERRRSRRLRYGVVALSAVILVLGALALAAVFEWPHVALGRDSSALARLSVPRLAGRVTEVAVHDETGGRVPVEVRARRLWPSGQLSAGKALTIEVTVRRPSWAGWLVGRTDRLSYKVRTPAARLEDRWLEVEPGSEVAVSFAAPVQAVRVRTGSGEHTLQLQHARRTVGLGVIADKATRAGSADVSAVARNWERQPRPIRVTWFPASKRTQALVQPAPGSLLRPGRPITITLSRPVASVLGNQRPELTPAASGRWSRLDSHTLSFQPTGLGFPVGASVSLRLPEPVEVIGASRTKPARSLRWRVPRGSVLRLQQLLAQAGYLPLDWKPAAPADPPANAAAQLQALTNPPAGRFTWRFPNTPAELKRLWRPGHPNDISRAAIMMFQDTHDLTVDSFAGPKVWHALLLDTLAGKRRSDGYSYVYVHRKLPQSLNLWHNGRVVLRSPGNTGVPAAPTQLGSFPVFEHIPVGTMSGTNPDGTHYHDPGIRYISYFNHGDAIHAFNRSSFGTPQSLGCVELPLQAAAKVWPYTPIGTLVTIEN